VKETRTWTGSLHSAEVRLERGITLSEKRKKRSPLPGGLTIAKKRDAHVGEKGGSHYLRKKAPEA